MLQSPRVCVCILKTATDMGIYTCCEVCAAYTGGKHPHFTMASGKGCTPTQRLPSRPAGASHACNRAHLHANALSSDPPLCRYLLRRRAFLNTKKRLVEFLELLRRRGPPPVISGGAASAPPSGTTGAANGTQTFAFSGGITPNGRVPRRRCISRTRLENWCCLYKPRLSIAPAVA